jgi:hypothetical protein
VMLPVKRIRDLLSTGSFESPLTDVLLDMQCLYGQEQDAVSKQVLHLLKLLETHTWAGIIIGGYGACESRPGSQSPTSPPTGSRTITQRNRPLPRHTKAQSWHNQSGLVTNLAQHSFELRSLTRGGNDWPGCEPALNIDQGF